MNRREFYRPLVERTLVNYQAQYLARKYDFGKESLVARLLVEEIDHRMEETEAILGIERVQPFELYVQKAQSQARLPLFCPEYLEPILGGGDFSMARNLILKRCLQSYRLGYPKGSQGDLLRIIDPWSLARGKGPSRYVDQLCQETLPYSKDRCGSLGPHDRSDPSAPACRPPAGAGSAGSRAVAERADRVRGGGGRARAGGGPPAGGRGDRPAPHLLPTHQGVKALRDASHRDPRQRPPLGGDDHPLQATGAGDHHLWKPEELERQPDTVPGFLAQLKRRIVRVCFEAYRQNGLLTLMELQWIFQISAARISELIRSVQKEHNLVVPIPGTILDAGRSMTHKDIIVGLHLEGYNVREIARMTHHSPRAVDNYIGTFEGVLVLHLFGVAPELMARLLKRGISLINEHLKLVREHYRDHQEIKEYLVSQGVKI